MFCKPFLLLFVFAQIAAPAKLPWNSKPAESWTAAEAQRVMSNSPWAQIAEAGFPDPRDRDAIPAQNLPGAAEAGMAGQHGVSDGKWDGGVGNNHGAGLPTLQVQIRWESAAPVRDAQSRLRALGQSAPVATPISTEESNADYVISVAGLIPAQQYRAPATLATNSTSDHDPAAQLNDTEHLLENLMSNSVLAAQRHSVRPTNARVDARTGTLFLFFPRTLNLQTKDKDAYMTMRYGSLIVKKHFRLGEMLYKGRLEL